MGSLKKWLFILATVIFIGSMFADKILSFYIDWLWFENHNIADVLWTVLISQLGLGSLTGILFFGITYGFLSRLFKKTSHLPILLSEQVRRELPLLDIIAENLKLLIVVAPLVLSVMTGLVMAQQWEVVLKYLNASSFNQLDPVFEKDIAFYIFRLPFWLMIKSFIWETIIVVSIGVG